MTRHQFDESAEEQVTEAGVNDVAVTLDRYAAGVRPLASAEFIESVMTAVERQPMPRRGWLAGLGGAWRGPFQAMAVAAGVVVLVGGTLLMGQVLTSIRDGRPGTTPPPAVTETQSPSPTPTPTLSPTPAPTLSPSPTPTLSPSPTPTLSPSPSQRPMPTASESQEPSETPEASETPEVEDRSGRGGGSDD